MIRADHARRLCPQTPTSMTLVRATRHAGACGRNRARRHDRLGSDVGRQRVMPVAAPAHYLPLEVLAQTARPRADRAPIGA